MNTVNTVKKQNLVKLKRKKKIIQRNRKIAIIFNKSARIEYLYLS